jgi:hypothetical protein
MLQQCSSGLTTIQNVTEIHILISKITDLTIKRIKFLQPTTVITNHFKPIMEHCKFIETLHLLVIMPMPVTRDVKTI